MYKPYMTVTPSPQGRGLRMSYLSVTRMRCVLFQITITVSCLFYCMEGEFEQIYGRTQRNPVNELKGNEKRFYLLRVIGIDGIQFAMSIRESQWG